MSASKSSRSTRSISETRKTPYFSQLEKSNYLEESKIIYNYPIKNNNSLNNSFSHKAIISNYPQQNFYLTNPPKSNFINHNKSNSVYTQKVLNYSPYKIQPISYNIPNEKSYYSYSSNHQNFKNDNSLGNFNERNNNTKMNLNDKLNFLDEKINFALERSHNITNKKVNL